jgi:hypothetical protein
VSCQLPPSLSLRDADAIRNATLLTAVLERFWQTDTSFVKLREKILWTYLVVVESGVFRTFPGHAMSASYDAYVFFRRDICTTTADSGDSCFVLWTSRFLRAWFPRAMANVDKLVVSVPYIDYTTGVVVLTICRTITSSVDRSRPLAVMCVDVPLDTFAKELRSIGSCTHPGSPNNLDGQCMLVNDGGYFVWDAELLAQARSASVTDASLTLHVGGLYRNVRDGCCCPHVG